MQVILASNNANKLREMKAILAPLGWEICSQREAGIFLEPEENGETFEENSRIKAIAIMKASGFPAIADDSGIAVDALSGAPGVHSARYGGESCAGDGARNRLLLQNMQDVPDGQRTARFVSVITMVYPDGREIQARGEIEGVILRQEIGDGGFGYDPLFYIPGEGCTMAQLRQERKNEISHRANALASFVNKLTGERVYADK